MFKKSFLLLIFGMLGAFNQLNAGLSFSRPVAPDWVSIKDLDKARLLAALVSAAPIQTFIISPESAQVMIAKKLSKREPLSFPRVCGKAINIDISGEVMDVAEYNRYAKAAGLAQSVIAHLREEL